MDKSYSEVEAEKVFEKNRFWFGRFRTTRSFKKLTKPEKVAAQYVTQAFVGLAYRYEMRRPRRYTAAMVEDVLLNQFPKRIAATNVFFTSIIPVMRRYIVFLGVQHKVGNVKTLLRALDNVSTKRLLVAHQDHANWDPHKAKAMTILMGTNQADVDPRKVSEFEQDYNMGVPLRFCFDLGVYRQPKNIILLTESLRKKFEQILYEKNN
ncbi:hypothetical protein FEZ41_03220 [Lentilactobacillus parafarraginis]|uniref:Uncharacterized protein n=3 Tax=Lentilactobacillus parafarraginis TaxID=390842 RepID=A0A0R1YJR8_9LACO|nr:hypothetical protein [Lentilactobacillus parafarraginis]EHM00279.1 hypothetical protein HMPREF9103_00647 [Lentilactobacillus parafarraginis F0439]KRM42394.1 hypothetical protein FD47_GL001922 [Lentilactobacillus parafarraginis DSM 18390 = JCM 14109]TLQ20403.1 hypothetical protein FEZ41_03220 [Lentilactobacillus parafarraginis]